MWRALLDIVTAVSLLIGVAAVGMWVRGERVADELRIHRIDWKSQHSIYPDSMVWVLNSAGRVTWRRVERGPWEDHVLQARDFQLKWDTSAPVAASGGLWMGWVVLGAAVVPAWRGVRWWVRRREERRGPAGVRVVGVVAWVMGAAAVLCAIFWGRSYPYFERVDWKLLSETAGVQVNSSMGAVMVAWTWKGPHLIIRSGEFALIRTSVPPSRGPLYKAASLVGPYTQFMGFTLGTDGSTSWPYNVLIVPWWFLEGVFLAGAIVAGRYVWVRRNWGKAGRCARCGYDMRATPERCPECGLEVKQCAEAAAIA